MLFCQEQVSTSQRKSKKNLPPHVCRSFLSNIHNLKNQSETQLLRRHQESQPGNHALLKIHLASQCLYAYPTSEKNKLSENQLQSTTETHYRHQELSKYGWVDPTISEELESNHLAINVSPLLGIPVGDNLSISHRRSA
jgi:DNA recombination-dependent growth factor C